MYYIAATKASIKTIEMMFISSIDTVGRAKWYSFDEAKDFNSETRAEDAIQLGRRYGRPWADNAQVVFIHPLNKILNRCPGSGLNKLSGDDCRCSSCSSKICPACRLPFTVDDDGNIPAHTVKY